MQLVFACRISIKFGRSHDRNDIQLVVTGQTNKGFLIIYLISYHPVTCANYTYWLNEFKSTSKWLTEMSLTRMCLRGHKKVASQIPRHKPIQFPKCNLIAREYGKMFCTPLLDDSTSGTRRLSRQTRSLRDRNGWVTWFVSWQVMLAAWLASTWETF